MKVLIYGINFKPEQVGIGKYSGELAEWLSEKGHEVRVITAPPYFPAWRIKPRYKNRYTLVKNEKITVQRCPIWVPNKPNGIKRLFHLASFAITSIICLIGQYKWKPNIIITVSPTIFCAPGALILGRICGERTLNCLHIQDFELDAAFELGILKGKMVRKIAEKLERKVMQSFDCVSTISKAMMQRLEYKGVDKSRIYFLPNWVDIYEIVPESYNDRYRNAYRKKLLIQSHKIILMYSGSMNKKQDFKLLIEVIHELADIPEIEWLLGGEGPSKEELIAGTKGIPNVRHLPLQPREELNEWLNAADIHVLPQKGQAADLVLPSKLLGIMSSGKPVVSSSFPETELAQLTNEAGCCVGPSDSKAFAAAIRHFISDPEARLEAGKKARLTVEKYFGKEKIMESYEKYLLIQVKYKGQMNKI